jgi:hypothetical protein
MCDRPAGAAGTPRAPPWQCISAALSTRPHFPQPSWDTTRVRIDYDGIQASNDLT